MLVTGFHGLRGPTNHLLQDCPMLRLPLAAPRHRDFGEEIGSVQGSHGRLLLHLHELSAKTDERSNQGEITSLSDLRESKTGTPLKVNVFGIH